MDERGLWKLFFATGLPEAYLAIAGERSELRRERESWEERAKTAFRPRYEKV